mmetsp:Transcript_51178/g.147716  ORF Transcript_51178/g.147716 Transcript_51178/m.147716 type:complete len:222 (+) Transcript_51178:979-1644(+)
MSARTPPRRPRSQRLLLRRQRCPTRRWAAGPSVHPVERRRSSRPLGGPRSRTRARPTRTRMLRPGASHRHAGPSRCSAARPRIFGTPWCSSGGTARPTAAKATAGHRRETPRRRRGRQGGTSRHRRRASRSCGTVARTWAGAPAHTQRRAPGRAPRWSPAATPGSPSAQFLCRRRQPLARAARGTGWAHSARAAQFEPRPTSLGTAAPCAGRGHPRRPRLA